MSSLYEGIVQDLIDEFAKLPGVGPKGASRIAFHLLHTDREEIDRLATVLSEVREKARFCSVCFNVAQDELCRICADTRRDLTVLCVVEEPKDVLAIERTREFRGRYHVLLGLIDPLQGVNPEHLKVRELLTRIRPENIQEVVVCTSNNTEGDVTAMYLARLLNPLGVNVTRLASGLPVGGDIEFADEVTLGRAFGNRQKLDS